MFTERLSPLFRTASTSSPQRLRTRVAGGFLRAVLLVIAFAGVVPSAHAAGPLTAADRDAIRHTIRQQLDAFGRDDADGAFAHATADLQRRFGSSDNFMRMVRDEYEPVYRAETVQFGRLVIQQGRPVQRVDLVDGEGRVWQASFTMRRQADRRWKVGGCQLVQTSAIAT